MTKNYSLILRTNLYATEIAEVTYHVISFSFYLPKALCSLAPGLFLSFLSALLRGIRNNNTYHLPIHFSKRFYIDSFGRFCSMIFHAFSSGIIIQDAYGVAECCCVQIAFVHQVCKCYPVPPAINL